LTFRSTSPDDGRHEEGARVALRRKARKKSSSSSASGSATSRNTKTKAKGAGSTGVVAVLSDPKALRRMLLAAKIIGPAVAAGALRASTGVRGALDERRAHQLGVPVEDVAAYRGPAGAVQARIAGLHSALFDLRARRGTDPAVARFVDTTTARLGELSAATTATASMPPATRRSALRTVSRDLDDIDSQLMSYLVGPRAAA
jgi:hypothetical protein